MEVYLVRHGIAEDPYRASLSGKSDADRELTPEGREKTTKVARAFRSVVTDVGLILHSPYVRARETAEIFHRFFPGAEIAEAAGLRPHDPPSFGLASISEKLDRHNVMVVGHEPHLSALTSLLVAGNTDASIQFKKAGIAGFEWGGRGYSRLLFLLPPRFLLG